MIAVYRTRFPGHKFASCGGPEWVGLIPGVTGLVWAQVAVFLDQPLGIVAFDEHPHGIPQLVDVAVDAAMDDLLLEGAVEPLGDAVGLGLFDESVRGMDRDAALGISANLAVMHSRRAEIKKLEREALKRLAPDAAFQALLRLNGRGRQAGMGLADNHKT